MFKRIAIIGLGQMGGSLAKAIRTHGVAERILGHDHNEDTTKAVLESGIIDAPATPDSPADFWILAAPPSCMGEHAKRYLCNQEAGTLVTDVASVKMPVINAITPHLPPGIVYITSHPIAGSERSGFEASDGDLFDKRLVILSPPSDQETPALQKLQSFWEILGSSVGLVPPDLHDDIYAYVSHLPQLLSFCLPEAVSHHPIQNDIHQRFLRLNHSSKPLWDDIFTLNKGPLLAAIEQYLAVLGHIIEELKEGEESASDTPPPEVYHSLFPRIAASSLVASCDLYEQQQDRLLSPFLGMGFADFAAPALTAPEADIEQISTQFHHLIPLLEVFQSNIVSMKDRIS
jgi:prephenate dehydrogenase